MRNTFGNIFTVTTFGESHGAGVGGVVDGMPAGIDIDLDFIQHELDRRKPGQSAITTGRKEGDVVEILSGVFEGKSTGCPIGFLVRNTNQHSKDYENVRNVYRPSHADYTYSMKYGLRDHRGGGRSSARETISRCVGGAFAKLALRQLGIEVVAYTSQVGNIGLENDYTKYDLSLIESNNVRCPDAQKAEEMEKLILEVKSDGDTIGGIITCVIKGCPVGLGEPAFGKLHAQLGAAMLGINAVKGFEYGAGFAGVGQRGSEQNDIFFNENETRSYENENNENDNENENETLRYENENEDENENNENDNENEDNEGFDPKVCIRTRTNNSGGIQGGISNGEDIYFRVLFKPVATQLREQPTVDKDGNETVLQVKGRHDPCVLPRAVPVVEAMAAMTILDNYLLNKTVKL